MCASMRWPMKTSQTMSACRWARPSPGSSHGVLQTNSRRRRLANSPKLSMSYEVRLSRAAIWELERIRAYYTQAGAGRVAAQKYAAILSALKSLEQSPTTYQDDPDA